MRLESYAAIYTLSDPFTGEVRYVGKAFSLTKRLYAHIADKRKSHKTNWIRGLLERGERPKIEVIEEFTNVSRDIWEESERFWIQTLRFYGCRLTNLSNGGVSGSRHAPETIERISKANKGRIVSDEQRRKMSERIVSDETRRKNAEAARNISDATRLKMSLSHRGKKQSAESIEKRIAPLRGRKLSEATRAKMRLAQRNQSPDHGLKISLAKRGIPMSPSHRLANAQAGLRRRGSKFTPERLKAHSEALRNSAALVAHCRKMGIARRGIKRSPEISAKISEKLKASWARRKASGNPLSQKMRDHLARMTTKTRGTTFKRDENGKKIHGVIVCKKRQCL